MKKGDKMSDEVKAKISAANRGRKRSDDAKAKISAANRGRKRSDDVKAKISASKKGVKLSDETKAKLSLAFSGENNPNYGKHTSDETKAKISAAALGRRHSEEAKAKMSAARRGVPKSAEHAAKIGKAHVGKPAAHGKGQYFYNIFTGDSEWTRSSYELSIAKALTVIQMPYVIEPRPYPIRYRTSEGVKDGTYTPDFQLATGLLIEAKGWWRDTSKAKFEAFQEQYPELPVVLLMKGDLKRLGIFDLAKVYDKQEF